MDSHQKPFATSIYHGRRGEAAASVEITRTDSLGTSPGAICWGLHKIRTAIPGSLSSGHTAVDRHKIPLTNAPPVRKYRQGVDGDEGHRSASAAAHGIRSSLDSV